MRQCGLEESSLFGTGQVKEDFSWKVYLKPRYQKDVVLLIWSKKLKI
jgi:hypothetical protein